MEDKKKQNKSMIERIMGVDGFFYAGEGIKDVVVCAIVISVLLNYILPVATGPYQFLFYIGVMLVPISYTRKWFNILFKDNKENKR